IMTKRSLLGAAADQGAELAGGFAQRLLGHLPLGDVASDFGKADQFIVLIADRIDLHRRPEPAAVLAHAPALLLVMAVARRGFKNARRQAGHATAPAIKFGEGRCAS